VKQRSGRLKTYGRSGEGGWRVESGEVEKKLKVKRATDPEEDSVE
jgi:hypothetical protein